MRFGLEVPDLTTYLAGQGATLAAMRRIDEGVWARGCRIAPARPESLSLETRFLNRSGDWVSARTSCGTPNGRREAVCKGEYPINIVTRQAQRLSGAQSADGMETSAARGLI
jgi:hypothetical protein